MSQKPAQKSMGTLQLTFTQDARITGYLVGGLDRFNDAKRAEVRDRVKHGFGGKL
jgi:ribonucleoside-triphosphate reductase class III catalytic subunit (EC 1.17.4.2)